MSAQIFISHSSVDRPIVDDLVKLLVFSIGGLDKKDILFSSRASTGLTPGDQITESLVSEIIKCDGFIAVVSDSFLASRYCIWEYGVRKGVEIRKELEREVDGRERRRSRGALVASFPGVDAGRLGGVFSGVLSPSLADPASVQQLIREVADSLQPERTAEPDLEDIERFCGKAKEHPRNLLEKWRRRLVRRVEGRVFLNAYGLWDKPVDRALFQSFHPTGTNVQPVQYLWADPRKGNWIQAKVHKQPKPPKPEKSFLRVTYHHRRGSLGCNLSIRPQDNEPIFTNGRRSLVLEARVAETSATKDVGIVVRLVNGYMQHWRNTSGGRVLQVPKGDFQPITLGLDPLCWEIFDADGTGKAGPESPDFSILSSLNLSLGDWEEDTFHLLGGEGSLDIREIRLE